MMVCMYVLIMGFGLVVVFLVIVRVVFLSWLMLIVFMWVLCIRVFLVVYSGFRVVS